MRAATVVAVIPATSGCPGVKVSPNLYGFGLARKYGAGLGVTQAADRGMCVTRPNHYRRPQVDLEVGANDKRMIYDK